VIVAGTSITITNAFGNTLYAYISAINNAGVEGAASASSAAVILLDPNGDQDGDGMKNWAEDIAQTDPLDAGSFLRILSLAHANQLTWSSISNKTYQIEATTDLAIGFSALGGTITAVGPTTSYLDITATNSRKFYRVKVVP